MKRVSIMNYYKRKTIRNSAQDAKFYTPPDSPTQEYDDDKYDKYSSFSDKSSSISQNSNNNSKDSLNSKEGNNGTTAFGGILVTTIQVVERLSIQTMKDRRKSRIYNDIVISELIQDFDEAQKKYSEIKVVLTKSRPRLPLVKAPTSNPPHSNDPTDMDEDLPPIKYQSYPWVPEINIPPKLIHASLVPLSIHKELGSTRPLVTRIAKLKILNRNSSKRLSRANSKRKQKRVSAIIPRQQRASQIFRQNVLEQSVFLSFNGNVTTGNPQFYPTRKSIIGERELKKERRRKEKKKINKTLSDDESGEIDALNPIIIQKILDSEVLEKRIKEDLLIKQKMMSPKPPPRRATTELHLSTEINQSSDTTTAAHTFKRHKTTNSLLIAPLPDRRSVKSELNNRSLYNSIDFPTFPAHLSRHSYYTET
ncbi:13485_t:CDS:2 [Entrophospora sp. SA101]|nr:13475_t:CDS:2 [Entrophospora sp. SA101]CAJ0914679.1 13479_t:CDS:2 [Entrophospora sp. SA101]CAJ0914691.1 13485_t:CDS:2 [Entrophospora sp. SA101]